MKTEHKIVTNLIDENILPVKVSSLKKVGDIWGYQMYIKTHFVYKILQYTCFHWTCYTYLYVTWV